MDWGKINRMEKEEKEMNDKKWEEKVIDSLAEIFDYEMLGIIILLFAGMILGTTNVSFYCLIFCIFLISAGTRCFEKYHKEKKGNR